MTPVKERARTSALPELLSAKEAMALMGITKMTFKRWRDSGYFAIEPAYVGKDPVWTRDDIMEFSETFGRQRALPGTVATTD